MPPACSEPTPSWLGRWGRSVPPDRRWTERELAQTDHAVRALSARDRVAAAGARAGHDVVAELARVGGVHRVQRVLGDRDAAGALVGAPAARRDVVEVDGR